MELKFPWTPTRLLNNEEKLEKFSPFLNPLANLLLHPIIGRIMGILFSIPFLFFVYEVTISLRNVPSASLLLEILLIIFLGSFFAVFMHELGHLTTLNLLGARGAIEITPLILEIKTKLLTNHLRLSKNDNLMFRGLAGLLSNFLIGVILYVGFIIYPRRVLFGFFSLQFLACIGTTVWFLKQRDSDAAKLSEALSGTDNIQVQNIAATNDEAEIEIKVKLHLKRKSFLKYWIELQNLVNARLKIENPNLFIFNGDKSTLLIFKSLPLIEYLIQLKAKILGDITLISKCGTTILIPSEFKKL